MNYLILAKPNEYQKDSDVDGLRQAKGTAGLDRKTFTLPREISSTTGWL